MEPVTTHTGLPTDADSTGFAHFLTQTDEVGLVVVGLMAIMSVASWYIILTKSIFGFRVRRQGKNLIQRFWGAKSLEEALKVVSQCKRQDPFATVIRAGIDADSHYRKQRHATLADASSLSEFVTRALRNGIAESTSRMESGLIVLASVGSTAPFVGLFGTVWGIYHALAKLSHGGQTSIDQVAGPVGEALIMTACGLAVAIPAVLAYNALVRSNRVVAGQLDALAHDLHSLLATGSRVVPVTEVRDDIKAFRATVVAA